jgi:Uma2 family endonuclease
MISKANQEITTAEKLFSMPNDGNRYELIDGVLNMMSPAGSEHGRIAGRIFSRLAVHVEQYDLGVTYAAETGFRISTSPDTVRAPDAAFVSHERLASVEPTRGYLQLAPDLVVEVISPNDRFSEVESKAANWLRAGTEIVLVADPENRVLKVYTKDADIRTLNQSETFLAGGTCGGWQLDVNDVFQIKQ